MHAGRHNRESLTQHNVKLNTVVIGGKSICACDVGKSKFDDCKFLECLNFGQVWQLEQLSVDEFNKFPILVTLRKFVLK